jgi:PAS domain S-box-containing protein
LIPILIVGGIGFLLGRQGIHTHTDLHLQSVVALKAEDIDRWLGLHRFSINWALRPNESFDFFETVMTSDPESDDYREAKATLDERVDFWGELPTALTDVVVLDTSGIPRYSTDPSLLNTVSRESARLVAAGASGTHFAILPSTSVVDDIPVLVIAEPLGDSIKGVVVASIQAESLSQILVPDPGLGPNSVLYLTNPDVGVISSQGIQLGQTEALQEISHINFDGELFVEDVHGIEMAGQSTMVGDLPWRVIAALPTADAFADVEQVKMLIIVSLAIIGTVGGLVAWRLAVTITRPLKRVVAGADEIRRGNLDHRISVTSDDEVGELARSFNEMSAGLVEARADVVRAEREIAYREIGDRILQATPISLIVVNSTSALVTSNKEFYSKFMVDPTVSAGRNLTELVDLGTLKPIFERSLEQRSSYVGQWECDDTSVKQHQFAVAINSMNGMSGGEAQFLVTLEDITDRVAAEWRYQHLMDNANDGVFVIDAKRGTIIEANAKAAEMIGLYDKSGLAGTSVELLHPVEMSDIARKHHQVTMERGWNVFEELPLVRSDGSTLDVQVSAKVIELGGQQVILSMVRDISARKMAERELSESQARYQSLVENSPDAIFVHRRSYMVYSNPAAVALFGADSPEQLREIRAIELIGEEFREFVREGLKNVYESKEPSLLTEVSIRRLDGEARYVETKAAFITYQGAPAAQIVMRDITEKKQTQQRLAETSRLASVGELAAGVAHEINNPLTSVLGYAELLMRQDIPDRIRRDLNTIAYDAQRASKVVQNLLSFSRRAEPEVRPEDVTKIVDQAIELKAYEFRVNNIQYETDYDTKGARALVDRHQLTQVAINLLTNAEQAMTEANGGGKLTISTSIVDGQVRISIADDGPGIPSSAFDRVFDPFFTTKEVGKGTGLGLSICYGIVQQHNGELSVENNQDGGATFHIDLPIAPVGEISEQTHTNDDLAVGGLKQILVVDDEPVIRELLEKNLSLLGHGVNTAADGAAAWELIESLEYDHIILDMKMPGMNGMDFFHMLKEADADVADRVIFLTGDTLSGDTRSFLASTGRPALSKPFLADDLIRVLRDPSSYMIVADLVG